MTPEELEDFLDSAAHTVADLWEGTTNKRLDSDEFCALVDVLDIFFTDRLEQKEEENA